MLLCYTNVKGRHYLARMTFCSNYIFSFMFDTYIEFTTFKIKTDFIMITVDRSLYFSFCMCLILRVRRQYDNIIFDTLYYGP